MINVNPPNMVCLCRAEQPTAHPNKCPIDVMFGDAQADYGVGLMSKLSFHSFPR